MTDQQTFKITVPGVIAAVVVLTTDGEVQLLGAAGVDPSQVAETMIEAMNQVLNDGTYANGKAEPLPQHDVQHRIPYVGDGVEGALRSAEIDRTELDGLPTGPHQPGWTTSTQEARARLVESISQWEAQAQDLERAQVPEHVNYPHEPGRLHDCPACEARCWCTEGHVECVYDGQHNGLGVPV